MNIEEAIARVRLLDTSAALYAELITYVEGALPTETDLGSAEHPLISFPSEALIEVVSVLVREKDRVDTERCALLKAEFNGPDRSAE